MRYFLRVGFAMLIFGVSLMFSRLKLFALAAYSIELGLRIIPQQIQNTEVVRKAKAVADAYLRHS